jgi:hypothetical protein
MISSDPRPAEAMARRVTGRSAHKQVMMVISALLFATAFIFATAPAATAAEAVENNGSATFWEYDPCRGEKPGVCPDYTFRQFGTQRTTSPHNHQPTAHHPQSSP